MVKMNNHQGRKSINTIKGSASFLIYRAVYRGVKSFRRVSQETFSSLETDYEYAVRKLSTTQFELCTICVYERPQYPCFVFSTFKCTPPQELSGELNIDLGHFNNGSLFAFIFLACTVFEIHYSKE